MKERPINMKAWEVRAIREGRKTQFRRVIREVPTHTHLGRKIMDWPLSGVYTDDDGKHWLDVQTDVDDNSHALIRCPYGQPGDRLWVRETWQFCDYDGPGGDPKTDVVFRADGETDDKRSGWKPSIYMPRWASRITLEAVSVRVERLNEISGYDAIAEGIEPFKIDLGGAILTTFRDYLNNRIDRAAHQSYRSLWESINGPGSWSENPFVWVVEFKRVEGGGK